MGNICVKDDKNPQKAEKSNDKKDENLKDKVDKNSHQKLDNTKEKTAEKNEKGKQKGKFILLNEAYQYGKLCSSP